MTHRPFLLLLVPLLGLVPAMPARAASFDCTRAASSFEKAICADPKLSQTDEILAVAYATALGGLTPDAAAIMKKGQQDWLGMAQRACTDNAEPATEPYGKDRLFCLQNTFDRRISTLENSRMIGGLRVYTADAFAIAPDPEGTEWSKVATKMLSAPRIDGTSEFAAAFNAYIAEQSIDLAQRIAKGAEAEDFDTGSDEWLMMQMISVNDQRVSVEVNNYWYGHGAAHGNFAITYLHFLREQNRPLEASDVFAAKDWQSKFADLVFARLQADLGEGLQVENASDIVEAVSDPGRWSFSPEGLEVTFQPYEVAAYALGAPGATIAWPVLYDLLVTGAESFGWA